MTERANALMMNKFALEQAGSSLLYPLYFSIFPLVRSSALICKHFNLMGMLILLRFIVDCGFDLLKLLECRHSVESVCVTVMGISNEI